MYDRAPRALTVAITGTADEVGPGTYTRDESTTQRRTDAYAPFLSMTMRESFLTVTDEVLMAPGPGQYDLTDLGRVKGGSTLANRSQRFKEAKNNVPGPGAYNVSKAKESKGKKAASLLTMLHDDDKYKRVTYQRKPDPPSIPTPGQAYGYHEGDSGTLKKQKPPAKDKSLGPAYYKVNDDETAAVQKYRGIHFGNMTSVRKDIRGTFGPGPGQYDPFKPKPKAPIDYIIEEQRKKPLDSKLPRYHEVIEIVEEKKAVPGPGKYKIKSQFDQARTQPSDAAEKPPFGSAANRFSDSKTTAPAPGSYNDPRHALEALNKMTGLKRSPFGQTSVRFRGEHHVKKTPGPSHYLVEDKGTGKRHPQTSSVFVSTTNRLQTPAQIVNENPPPGSYEVTKSFDKTQGRVLYPTNNPEFGSARKNGAFLSSTKRFSKPRDIIINQTNRHNPGPGKYDLKVSSAPGGMLVSKEGRFKPLKNDLPGPGAYELSPVVRHTVLKGTFNATLNNPLAQSFEETDTRSRHNRELSINA
eukprot:gene12955-14285_t